MGVVPNRSSYLPLGEPPQLINQGLAKSGLDITNEPTGGLLYLCLHWIDWRPPHGWLEDVIRRFKKRNEASFLSVDEVFGVWGWWLIMLVRVCFYKVFTVNCEHVFLGWYLMKYWHVLFCFVDDVLGGACMCLVNICQNNKLRCQAIWQAVYLVG